eukprot:gene8423-17367_t
MFNATIFRVVICLFIAILVEIDSQDLDTNVRYLVLQISRLGLANRLRSMADWYVISTISSRTLLVSWEATIDCNITFPEIFNTGPTTLKLLPFHLPIDGQGEKLVSRMAMMNNMTYLSLDIQSTNKLEKNFLMNPNEVNSDIQVVYTTYDGIISLQGLSPQQYLYTRSKFLSELIPNNFIQENVAKIKNDHFNDCLMIGIHYRAHDPRFDWEVVPPKMGDDTAQAFGVGATVEDFERVMRSIQSNFAIDTEQSNKYRIVPKVRFFVASNDLAAKQYLLRQFPDSIAIMGDGGRDS